MHSSIQFRPWRQEATYLTGIRGKKILILGESHYHNCEEDHGCDASAPERTREYHHEITRKVVRDWKDHPHRSPLSTSLPKLFGMDKAEFWNQVGFYNYVQSFLSAARVRPTKADWFSKDSAIAFQEVLDDLSPDRILVLGKGLWSALPSNQSEVIPPVGERRFSLEGRFGSGVDDLAYWYSSRSGKPALAMPIVHPSSWGFRVDDWLASIQKWLDFDELPEGTLKG